VSVRRFSARFSALAWAACFSSSTRSGFPYIRDSRGVGKRMAEPEMKKPRRVRAGLRKFLGEFNHSRGKYVSLSTLLSVAHPVRLRQPLPNSTATVYTRCRCMQQLFSRFCCLRVNRGSRSTACRHSNRRHPRGE
jgi:hypothetical protein